MEILENAISERLELAYFALINENEKVKENVESVKELSARLDENINIPKEIRRQIEDYKDISNFIESELQKFIYTEGIKDCIKLLKVLGILA